MSAMFKRGLKEMTDGESRPATRRNDALGVTENGLEIQDGKTTRFLPLHESAFVETDSGLIVQRIDIGGQTLQLPVLDDPPIVTDGGNDYLVLKTSSGTRRVKLA